MYIYNPICLPLHYAKYMAYMTYTYITYNTNITCTKILDIPYHIYHIFVEEIIKTLVSLDCFKGHFTGKNPFFHGKIDGFRFRLSLQAIHWVCLKMLGIFPMIASHLKTG